MIAEARPAKPSARISRAARKPGRLPRQQQPGVVGPLVGAAAGRELHRRAASRADRAFSAAIFTPTLLSFVANQ